MPILYQYDYYNPPKHRWLMRLPCKQGKRVRLLPGDQMKNDWDQLMGLVVLLDNRSVQIMVVMFDEQVVFRYMDTLKLDDMPLSEFRRRSNLDELCHLD